MPTLCSLSSSHASVQQNPHHLHAPRPSIEPATRLATRGCSAGRVDQTLTRQHRLTRIDSEVCPIAQAAIQSRNCATTSNRRAATTAPISIRAVHAYLIYTRLLHFGYRICQSFALESAYALSCVKCDEIGYVFRGVGKEAVCNCAIPFRSDPTFRHIFPSAGCGFFQRWKLPTNRSRKGFS